MITGLLGLLIFAADVYAIITILKSPFANGPKILWCLLIILLPVFGLIIWYVVDPA
jgi:hypothetical protein